MAESYRSYATFMFFQCMYTLTFADIPYTDSVIITSTRKESIINRVEYNEAYSASV